MTAPVTGPARTEARPGVERGPGLPARAFPTGFLWGAATAAFQIEGATHEDGRTDSIWDTFCRVPGAVVGGDTGDVACDHYHRWPADLDLMAGLGIGAYRFSTAWPRIVPAPGVIEQRGLDFYSRLVDGLLERDILPWLSLYHWDLPQWMEDRGGWASRDVVGRMTDYALAVHGTLGDRVRHWTTFNEPWCTAFLGYAGGQHAPGRQEPQAAVSATHHLLLAHGQVTRALRSIDPTATLGLTVNATVADPAHAYHPQDVVAARRKEALLNRLFVEPVVLGHYPEEAVAAFEAAGTRLPIEDGDLELIAAPIDFLGVNYYTGGALCAYPPSAAEALPGEAQVARPTSDPNVGLGEVYVVSRGLPRTSMEWEVQPDGLRRLLESLHTEYTGPAGIALYVTENGSAYDDEVGPGGSIDDVDRTSYLVSHLAAVHQAVEAGVDVRGYFTWSLLDNFEWAYGYAKRFGIVGVDFDTLERTPKTSALAYGRIARSGRLPEDGTVSA